MSKLFLVCSPAAVPSVDPPEGITVRALTVDTAGLESDQALLLRAAYAVSPDLQPDTDDGEDAVLFWRGEWGPPVVAATLGAFDVTGRLVGLSYVCDRTDEALLADLVVAPDLHGKGVGAALISASAVGLVAAGRTVFGLAVHQDNIGALSVYARMGFRLFAEGCLEGDTVSYLTFDQFDAVNAQIYEVAADMMLSPQYSVSPVPVPQGFVPRVNRSYEHRLPGRILALVTGHRRGDGSYLLTRNRLQAAIWLLEPAEAATIYQHPNLESWRAARDTGAETFVVRFGTDVDVADVDVADGAVADGAVADGAVADGAVADGV